MNTDLYIVAKVGISQEYREEFLAMARDLVAASASENGNIMYTLNESVSEPGTFIFIEHWKSQAAIDEHNKTPHFAVFLKAVQEKSLAVAIEIAKPVV